jgi:hypothetical protein
LFDLWRGRLVADRRSGPPSPVREVTVREWNGCAKPDVESAKVLPDKQFDRVRAVEPSVPVQRIGIRDPNSIDELSEKSAGFDAIRTI